MVKKIGYIHKYSPSEKKGILVYGYNNGSSWKSPSPILFSKEQCVTAVKTGCLVYFKIDENNHVSDIQQASIFNFDKELIHELVSVFDSKDWYESSKYVRIRYQNIYELEEFYEYEEPSHKTEEDEELVDELDWDFDDIFDDDENITSTGEYRKITIPTLIEEEYSLFGKPFRSKQTSWWETDTRENQYIYIDLLDPNFWIRPIPKSRKNYFGKNCEEFIELFQLLVLKERCSHEDYLRNARFHRNDHLWKLDLGTQRSLHPELFVNDCVCRNWTILLERLPYEEIKKVYNKSTLLQPILPIDFCKQNIEILSEEYGFPSIEIANLFLTQKIRNVKTATEFCHIKKRLRVYKNCGSKHLPEEGVPFCALGKDRLNVLTRNIGRRYSVVHQNVKFQILQANPSFDFDKMIDDEDKELILNIGRFFDIVREFTGSDRLCFFDTKGLISIYENLPKQISSLFDGYLSKVFKDKLKQSIEEQDLSPYRLHAFIDTLSNWIDEEFVSENSELLQRKYSNDISIEDLKVAYEYQYIPENIFKNKYLELTKNYTPNQQLKELTDHWGYTIPDDIQIFILRSKLAELDLSNVVQPYRNSDYICYEYTDIHTIYDFLQWIKERSKYRDSDVSRNVYRIIQDDLLSQISPDDCWYLFERELLYTPGEHKVKEILSEAYSKLNFKAAYLTRDCFQSQIAKDVIHFLDSKLIIKTLDILNQEYRETITDSIAGFGKVYLWSLNPNANVDLNELRIYFKELPADVQKRIFRFLFKVTNQNQLDIDILQFFTEISETQVLHGVEETEKDKFCWIFNDVGNICAGIYVLIIILKSKLKSPNLPIKYSMLKPALTMFAGGEVAVFRALKDFFEECRGWLLLSNESRNIEYFSRNGYVDIVNDPPCNGYRYKVCFYDSPLDFYGKEVEYLDDTDIRTAEAVLKKNFNYLHKGDGIADEEGYLIHEKDEIKLKEYVTQYDIDDKCGLFDDIFGFGEDQGYGLPEHTNYPTRYKENETYICSCGLYKDVDSSYGIPYRWCMKSPCTRRFNFLNSDSDWEKYKFADFLWILTKGGINRDLLWQINYEVSSFLNKIIKLSSEQKEDIESSLPKENDEVGIWSSDMSIFTSESCDNHNDDSDDEEYDYDYEDEYRCEDTYDRYSGSWAQDVEGYSDDDIDTIFDGDPDAYWNID